MTKVLTNRLFGRGRTWNGKAFEMAGRGRNRFFVDSSHRTVYQHEFQYAMKPSRLAPNVQVVALNYEHSQSYCSLWKTMRDELRVVPIQDNQFLVLGLGYMAWSGGVWNASPFCLYPVDES